jgi:hypothetical protein
LVSASPALAYTDWDIYTTYDGVINYSCPGGSKTAIPIRYGDSTFGIIHIEQGHGPFTSWDSTATGYNLAYGRLTSRDSAQQKDTYQVRWDGFDWVTVVAYSCRSPQDRYITGVITSYHR